MLAEESLKSIEFKLKAALQEKGGEPDFGTISEEKESTVKVKKVESPKGQQHSGQLSDATILRIIENAMDEMVKSEISEQSPYAY